MCVIEETMPTGRETSISWDGVWVSMLVFFFVLFCILWIFIMNMYHFGNLKKYIKKLRNIKVIMQPLKYFKTIFINNVRKYLEYCW